MLESPVVFSLEYADFENSLKAIFRGTYVLSVDFKLKPLQISVFLCHDKSKLI